MAGNSIVDKIFQCILPLMLFQTAFTSGQVPSVMRNTTDSFGAKDVDCNEQPTLCSRRNASCKVDGSCVCKDTVPDYVNPMITVTDGYLSFGTSDGCISFSSVINSLDTDNLPCSYSFFPYQVMPNRWTNQPTTFVHSNGALYKACNFTSGLAKYPGDKVWKPLVWLNKSYVDINITFPGYLDFAWTRSVPELHGLMIIINLNCSYRMSAYTENFNNSISKQCLRAKVLGSISSISSLTPNHSNVFYLALVGLCTLIIHI